MTDSIVHRGAAMQLSAFALAIACALPGVCATLLLTERDCPATNSSSDAYTHVRETTAWVCQAADPPMARDECVEANCVWTGDACVGTTCTYDVVDGRWVLMGSVAERVLGHTVTDDVAYSGFVEGVLMPHYESGGGELRYTCPGCPLQLANDVPPVGVIVAVVAALVISVACIACMLRKSFSVDTFRVTPGEAAEAGLRRQRRRG